MHEPQIRTPGSYVGAYQIGDDCVVVHFSEREVSICPTRRGFQRISLCALFSVANLAEVSVRWRASNVAQRAGKSSQKNESGRGMSSRLRCISGIPPTRASRHIVYLSPVSDNTYGGISMLIHCSSAINQI